jgi:hypothetical protein
MSLRGNILSKVKINRLDAEKQTHTHTHTYTDIHTHTHTHARARAQEAQFSSYAMHLLATACDQRVCFCIRCANCKRLMSNLINEHLAVKSIFSVQTKFSWGSLPRHITLCRCCMRRLCCCNALMLLVLMTSN